MSRTLTLSSDWYTGLSEKRQRVWASKLADLCSPAEEVATLQGLLEETDSFTITVDAQKNPIAFRIGELACPVEEDPSAVKGGATPELLSLRQVQSQPPGTTFGVLKEQYVVPPDTRTGLRKLISSAPKGRREQVPTILGTYVRAKEYGNPQYNGGYEVVFSKGVATHDGPADAPGMFFKLSGGSRSSRVKKQTRRTQRKRRNTIRK